jgi:Meiotically up-regulated gene 113
MHLPPQPGVYVVELLNDHPISVNADRPAIAERCIKVTRANCKYGQAVNLARRQRDYFKTFGEQYVRFRYFAVTHHYAAIEAEVGARLVKYRLSGGTGRLNEWLERISPEEVEMVVRAAVESRAGATEAIAKVGSVASPKAVQPRATAGVSPAQLVEAAEYLESHGMSVALLRDIHHSPRRDETFKSTRRYFAEKTNLLQTNILYGVRLVYVADQHRIGGNDFEELVQEALHRHPK